MPTNKTAIRSEGWSRGFRVGVSVRPVLGVPAVRNRAGAPGRQRAQPGQDPRNRLWDGARFVTLLNVVHMQDQMHVHEAAAREGVMAQGPSGELGATVPPRGTRAVPGMDSRG